MLVPGVGVLAALLWIQPLGNPPDKAEEQGLSWGALSPVLVALSLKQTLF